MAETRNNEDAILQKLDYFVCRNHRWPVDSPQKGPVMRICNIFFAARIEKAVAGEWDAWALT